MAYSQRALMDVWPEIQDDFKNIMWGRPGWLIGVLEQALQ